MKANTSVDILKSEKGIAMESAVIFMVVSAALCILLTTLSLIGRHQIKIQDSLNDKNLERTIIGEDFMSYIEAAAVQMPPEDGTEETPESDAEAFDQDIAPPAEGDKEDTETPAVTGPESFGEFYAPSIRNALEERIYNEKYYFTDTKTFDEENYVTTFELTATYRNSGVIALYMKAEKTPEGQITLLSYMSCVPNAE